MAIAFVQETGHGVSGTAASTFAVSVAHAPTAGNLIIAGVTVEGTTLSSVSDSKGNTWTIDKGQTEVSSTYICSTPMDVGTLTTSDTITFHLAANYTGIAAVAHEFSGLDTSSSRVDQTSGGVETSSTTARTAGTTGTTTVANELVYAAFGLFGSETGFTAGTGYTAPSPGYYSQSNASVEFEYQIVSATGAYNPTGTGVASHKSEGAAVTYKAASGGSTYNDSGSGTITLSASTAESHLVSDVASGTIQIGGSSSDGYARLDTASGTIQLTGSGSEAHLVSDVASGTIQFTGSSTDNYQPPGGTHSDSGSGTIALSASITESHSVSDAGSGAITLSGSAAEVHGYQDSASGTFTLSGSGTEGISYTWAPTATLFFSGSEYDDYIGGQIALAIALLLGDHGPLMNLNWRVVAATLDNSYPTGGYALTPDELGFITIRLLLPIPYGGYVFQWTGSKLMAFQNSGSAGPMIEVNNGTDLSSESLNLFIIGDHI